MSKPFASAADAALEEEYQPGTAATGGGRINPREELILYQRPERPRPATPVRPALPVRRIEENINTKTIVTGLFLLFLSATSGTMASLGEATVPLAIISSFTGLIGTLAIISSHPKGMDWIERGLNQVRGFFRGIAIEGADQRHQQLVAITRQRAGKEFSSLKISSSLITQLFTHESGSILSTLSESIFDKMPRDITTDQFLSLLNNIFTGAEIRDEKLSTAMTRAGEQSQYTKTKEQITTLLRSGINYGRAYGEISDPNLVQFLFYSHMIGFLNKEAKNPESTHHFPNINLEELEERYREFRDNKFLPLCRERHGETKTANHIENHLMLLLENFIKGGEIDLEEHRSETRTAGGAVAVTVETTRGAAAASPAITVRTPEGTSVINPLNKVHNERV